MKQIQLHHNVGVVLCTGCTGVLQNPSRGLSDDGRRGPPGLPVEVLAMVKVRDSERRTAIPEQKKEVIRISKNIFESQILFMLWLTVNGGTDISHLSTQW